MLNTEERKKTRDYIYHESTVAICPVCFRKLDGKIILKDGKVYIYRVCPDCGEQIDLLEEDSVYWLNRKKYDKPGNSIKAQTEIKSGCPYDCGLCANHGQHSCIGIIEITEDCNLECPVCYSESKKGMRKYLSIEKIKNVAEFLIEAEGGEAEVLQISGGEPTMHPNILEIITMLKTLNIRYVMLNTNGLRLAEDEEFAYRLGKIAENGGFEVYLQFDGLSDSIYEKIRGRKLYEIKMKAIKNLQKYSIPATLVMTVIKDINEEAVCNVVEFALKEPYIRGVNLQPICYSGRVDSIKRLNRTTLSGLVDRIYKNLGHIFRKGSIVPLPCNVERVAFSFMFKSKDGKYVPVTEKIDIEDHLDDIDNTFAFNLDNILKKGFICSCCMNSISGSFLKEVFDLLPANFMFMSKKNKIEYINNNIFRLSISSFVDKYNFDLKSAQKECAHIITEDYRRIPFSMYNMLHRGKKQ